MVKATAADTSVKSETFAKSGASKERLLENDGEVNKTARPYEQIYTFEETTKDFFSITRTTKYPLQFVQLQRICTLSTVASTRVQAQI